MNECTDGLDRWFESDAWKQITQDADDGDEDSKELMQQVSDQMGNLLFHLHNESCDEKILYELSYFDKLGDDLMLPDTNKHNTIQQYDLRYDLR